MELGAKLKLAGARRTAVPELWLLREATNGRIDPRKGLQHPTPLAKPGGRDHCCPAEGFYEWREEGGASIISTTRTARRLCSQAYGRSRVQGRQAHCVRDQGRAVA
jgi:hypothetical protein